LLAVLVHVLTLGLPLPALLVDAFVGQRNQVPPLLSRRDDRVGFVHRRVVMVPGRLVRANRRRLSKPAASGFDLVALISQSSADQRGRTIGGTASAGGPVAQSIGDQP
jgi:hypothetical protein